MPDFAVHCRPVPSSLQFWWLSLYLAVALSVVSPARGQENPTIVVLGSEEACPKTSAMANVLRGLLLHHQVAVGPAVGALTVRVQDLGERYRVQLDQDERLFPDPDRRCDDRASTAAAFVATKIELITLPSGPSSVHVPVQVRHAAPASRPPRARWPLHLDLEAGGTLDAAPFGGEDGAIWSGGGSVRLAVRLGPVGGTVGLRVFSLPVLALGDARLQLLHIPIDLSVRGGLRWGRIEGVAEAGLLLSLTSASSQGSAVKAGPQVIRVDTGWYSAFAPGIHVSLLLRVWVMRNLAAFGSVTADMTPSPSRVSIAQGPTLGTAPWLWLGGTAGLAMLVK